MRIVAALIASLMFAAGATGQTYNYEYDVHGRLTKVTPSSGNRTCYWYDAANNRVAVEAASSCTGSTSPSAPAAGADVIYVPSPITWGILTPIEVLANDWDTDLPNDRLEVISVTGDSHFTPQPGDYVYGVTFNGSLGAYSFTYTIRDSAGLTSTNDAYVEIFYCPFGEEC